jgi:hypothetical protein
VLAILFLTLPTQPNAVRLRVWRALKALGCGSIRDGTYLLPQQQANLFEPLAEEVRAHGGEASVMQLAPVDASQADEMRALFDRREAYAQWRTEADTLLKDLAALDEADARRRLRGVADALLAVNRIDYFPGAAAEQADAHLSALRQSVDAVFSQGEPSARTAHGIARLDRRKHQGRRWATRARPWVDRLACAWLIRRFIDPQAQFVWLADPLKPPRGVLGFDYDGARFTHTGSLVTFEVIAASFGLDSDPRLQRIARAVHYLDVGGIPAPEAAGLEAVLAGLRALHADDDELCAAAASVFDALYAAAGIAQ